MSNILPLGAKAPHFEEINCVLSVSCSDYVMVIDLLEVGHHVIHYLSALGTNGAGYVWSIFPSCFAAYS